MMNENMEKMLDATSYGTRGTLSLVRKTLNHPIQTHHRHNSNLCRRHHHNSNLCHRHHHNNDLCQRHHTVDSSTAATTKGNSATTTN
jgi:hypothetical protein